MSGDLVDTHLDSFVISLPPTWTEIELDPDRFVESTRERVRSDGGDALADSLEFRRQLLAMERILEQSQLVGLVFLAAYGDMMEPAGAATGGSITTAAVYIVTVPAERLGVDSLSFADLRVAVSEMDLPANAESVDDPIVLDLGQGPLLRESLLYRDRQRSTDFAALGLRYFSTIGEGEGLAVLGFITPNVALADEFTDLFDSIATTLEFVKA